MDFAQYQAKARETAIYIENPNIVMRYPAMGIIGECGEVAEKIKKLWRDDDCKMTEKRRVSIKHELGGCMWYLANICCDTDHDLKVAYTMRTVGAIHSVRGMTIERKVIHMHSIASQLASHLEHWYSRGSSLLDKWNYKEIPELMSRMLVCIEAICIELGLTIENVCAANLEQLASRKARGTLRGDGDNR